MSQEPEECGVWERQAEAGPGGRASYSVEVRFYLGAVKHSRRASLLIIARIYGNVVGLAVKSNTDNGENLEILRKSSCVYAQTQFSE